MSSSRDFSCTLFKASGKGLLAGYVLAAACVCFVNFMRNAIVAEAGQCIDPRERMITDAIYLGVFTFGFGLSAMAYFLDADRRQAVSQEAQPLISRPQV